MGRAYPESVSLYAPHPSPFGSAPAGLGTLDARARDIFRRIVETYLETGEPVGSRTISRGGLALSPASIRNTMQDLTQLGLLGAPHVSAGRIPTHAGLRLFVDGLLEVGDIAEDDRRAIETRLSAKGRNFEEALNEATAILSGLAGGAGVVVSPVRDAGVKHVEFVALSADQALAVMVFEDGVVENRLMKLAAGVTPSSLQEASNFMNARLRGRTLARALASPHESADPVLKNFVVGMEMTEKALQAAFENNGLKKIDPAKGVKFDPHQHQAMMEQTSTEVAAGGVIQVLQPGYDLLGRLIRPAMVVVAAKGSTGEGSGGDGSSGANPYAANDGDGSGGSVDTRA